MDIIKTTEGITISHLSLETEIKVQVSLLSNVIIIEEKRDFLSCAFNLKVRM